jgi:DNA (cytosine-5)-methyltransferase 1
MPEIILIDLFSGAGGVTTGVERATVAGCKVCKVIAAVNHDELAISSHAANHGTVHHFVEDIRTLEMSKLRRLVDQARRQYPEAILILWASLECTNFSKAKGGLPRDADSRTLADHMDRYVIALQPDVLYIENVVEFMSWGPLDENGKPVSKTEGRDYILWVNRIMSYGYNFDYRVMNSANFGAFTSRERYFAQFTRHGMQAHWPEATHAKKPRQNGMFGTLAPWRAVKEVLDLDDYGTSIFDRAKPLVDNTLERILAGLEKFVARGENTFIQAHYSGKPKSKVISIDVPVGSQTTTHSHSIIHASYLLKYNSAGTDGNKRNCVGSIEDPAPVVSTQGRLCMCTAFLTSYYGNSDSAQSIEQPAGTITTKDRIGLVHATQFISRNFSAGHNCHSINKPAGSLTGNPKMNLVTPFLIDQNFMNPPRSLDEPASTVLACRKHQYIINPHKKPLAFAAIDGKPRWTVQPGDTEMMLRIKAFMQQHNIADIFMRMLNIAELKRIMGFGDTYILHGSQADQKKFIGNAVETTQAQRNIEAVALGIMLQRKKTA